MRYIQAFLKKILFQKKLQFFILSWSRSVLPKKYRSTAAEVLQYLLGSTTVLLKEY